MSYWPAGCGYQVLYIDRSGQRTESPLFPDEYALGDWFMGKTDSGEIDREAEAERRPGGFRIYGVTEDRRVEIDHLHPRLVHGRLNRARTV
ncbi:MAG: hypothetical protein ACJ72W_07085 [Actinoallomurus sp.]